MPGLYKMFSLPDPDQCGFRNRKPQRGHYVYRRRAGKTNCYIANIVKCRPPRNRDPQESEQDACIPFLRNQVALVRPKVIVCLGRIAAKRVIDPDYRITRQHGQWVFRGGVWMTAIYHPSALLRDVSKRPETFVDLLSIREKLKEVGANV